MDDNFRNKNLKIMEKNTLNDEHCLKYDKEIRSLKGTSKEFYDVLKYITKDKYAALGYLESFENIHKKEIKSAVRRSFRAALTENNKFDKKAKDKLLKFISKNKF